MLNKELIEEKYIIRCPHCANSIYQVNKNGFEVPKENGRCWIIDGDVLPIKNDLTKEDWELYLKRSGIFLSQGVCEKCSEDYFVLEVSVANSDIPDRQFKDRYIYNEPEIEFLVSNSVLREHDKLQHSNIISCWTQSVFEVKGIRLTKNLIVLNIKDKEATGDNGMACCVADSLVWEEARKFASSNWKLINQEIENV